MRMIFCQAKVMSSIRKLAKGKGSRAQEKMGIFSPFLFYFNFFFFFGGVGCGPWGVALALLVKCLKRKIKNFLQRTQHAAVAAPFALP